MSSAGFLPCLGRCMQVYHYVLFFPRRDTLPGSECLLVQDALLFFWDLRNQYLGVTSLKQWGGTQVPVMKTRAHNLNYCSVAVVL